MWFIYNVSFKPHFFFGYEHSEPNCSNLSVHYYRHNSSKESNPNVVNTISELLDEHEDATLCQRTVYLYGHTGGKYPKP